MKLKADKATAAAAVVACLKSGGAQHGAIRYRLALTTPAPFAILMPLSAAFMQLTG